MKSLSSILLLIVLSLLAVYYYNLNVNAGLEGCDGMPSGIINLAIYVLGIGLFLGTAFSILRDGTLSHQFRIFLLLWLILLLFVVPLAHSVNGARLGRASWLQASGAEQLNLILREDHTFTMSQGFIEASCYHSGRYQRSGDTIRFTTKLKADFAEDFAHSYRIQDTLLIPLKEEKDSLRIE